MGGEVYVRGSIGRESQPGALLVRGYSRLCVGQAFKGSRKAPFVTMNAPVIALGPDVHVGLDRRLTASCECDSATGFAFSKSVNNVFN